MEWCGGHSGRRVAVGLRACAAVVRAGAGDGTPSRDAPDPAGMIGADSVALQRLFGPPRLVRRDAPAELWQYQTATASSISSSIRRRMG